MTDPFLEYLKHPDRRSLSRFILAYTASVERLVRRVVLSRDAAEDVVQETFLRLAESDVLAEDVPFPRGYVLRSALNTARNHLRSEKVRARHERQVSEVKPRRAPSAADVVTEREAVDRLYDAIDALPESLRLVIHLRAVDGLSYKEIALVTGQPLGTVGVRLQEARAKLRQLLGDRTLSVAWVNLELARERGWFSSSASQGLPASALRRLNRIGGRSRTRVARVVGFGAVSTIVLVAVLISVQGRPDQPEVEVARETGYAGRLPRTQPASRVADPVPPALAPVARENTIEKPIAPARAGADTETTVVEVDSGPASPRTTPDDEAQRGQSMTARNKVLTATVLALAAAAPAGGAETGDFDGDGRLTIRDVRNAMVPLTGGTCDDPFPRAEWEFAPGSDEAFRAYPCAADTLRQVCTWRLGWWPASVYLEVLRRAVPDGLASYSPMHWVEEWASAPPAPPLDVDERFSVRLLSVSQSADDEDRADLELVLTVLDPVVAFSLLLEVDEGAIRVPWFVEDPFWDYAAWAAAQGIHHFRDVADQGDLTVNKPVVGYLITNGRYVVTYGLGTVSETRSPTIEPGEYRVIVPARLPKGTPPGSVALRLLETSEVLFEDGVVAAPRSEGTGEIVVDREVVDGWDEGVPPLRLDPVERRVLGEVRFRLTGEEGNPAAPGQPLATGNPGDDVRLRVQVRTETPLNYIHFRLQFPTGRVTCGEGTRILLEDPESPGEPFPFGGDWPRNCIFGFGWLQGWFHVGGSSPHSTVARQAHGDRAWEYFKPLGEWLDLMEFELRIGNRATGDLPILFRRPNRRDPEDTAPYNGDVQFAPYAAQQFCYFFTGGVVDPELPAPNWQYDVVYEDDGFIRVGDPPDAPEPPGSGIFFELGSATGAPGETVEVPVFIEWEPHVRAAWHTLALEYDPSAIVVTAADLSVEAQRTPDDIRMVRVVQPRSGPLQSFRECLPAEECVPGGGEACCWTGRQQAAFHESDLRYAAIRFNGYSNRPDPQPFEIARLLVEIHPGTRPGTYELFPAKVPSTDVNGLPVTIESGAYDASETVLEYVLAEEVIGGLVHVAVAFRRGDSNQDGREDIADAIHSLGFLFADGTAPPCLDAADVNDDGTVNITDPVFLLGALFGGGGVIPEPASRCGSDPTEDRIGCEGSVCAE